MDATSCRTRAVNTRTDAVRKLIYVSGTRADFGLMCSTLQLAAAHPLLDVSVVATGMHLNPQLGHTVDEIHQADLHVCAQVPIDTDTRTQASMSSAIGACIQGLTQVFERERADIVLLLGDRGEMLAAAIAALHLGIVCVHVHGGERSGTVDEPVRHAISKLCQYHLVATRQSRERLLRMGEPAAQVFITGAPGLDGLAQSANVARPELCSLLGLSDAPFVLALFHPVVQQADEAYLQTQVLLLALQQLALPVVWMAPNADAGSLGILRALDEVDLPAGSQRFVNLPRAHFCAAMRHCAVLVGNSSAGIIEAASFGTRVLNLGLRQHLRERSDNVVDLPEFDVPSIYKALVHAASQGRSSCDNVYGDGHAGERIVALLSCVPLDSSVILKTNTY